MALPALQSPPFLCALNSSGKVTSPPQPEEQRQQANRVEAAGSMFSHIRAKENGDILRLYFSSLGLFIGLLRSL